MLASPVTSPVYLPLMLLNGMPDICDDVNSQRHGTQVLNLSWFSTSTHCETLIILNVALRLTLNCYAEE